MELKGLHASEKLALKFGCKHQISANSVNSPLPPPACIWTFPSFLMIFHLLHNFMDPRDQD